MAALRLLFNVSSNIWRSTTASVLNSQKFLPRITQVRTFKDREVLQLRCDECYFKKIDDRWHVLCRKHGRHKQRERIYDPRTKWIVTHVTRGGRPFQKKPEAYILNLCPPGGFDYKRRFFWPNWDEIKKEWHPKSFKK